jgi:hypothetical protein
MPFLALLASNGMQVLVYHQLFSGHGDNVYSVYVQCDTCHCAECIAEDMTVVDAIHTAFGHWETLNSRDYVKTCVNHQPGYLSPEVHAN